MTGITTAAGATVTVPLGGTPYTLSPWMLSDFADFDRWLQDKAMEPLGSARVKALPDADRRALQADIVRRANKLSLLSAPKRDEDAADLQAQLMASPESAAMMLLISARAHHPEVTLDELTELMQAPEVLEDALDAFDRINTPARPPGPSSPTTVAGPRRARSTPADSTPASPGSTDGPQPK